MIPDVSKESGRPVLDGLYQQLLRRGVQYFLPSSHLEVVGHVRESTPEIVFHATSHAGLSFEWLGSRYALTNHRQFSDHEQRMVRSIGRFLSTRYELLLDRETAAQNMPIFGGLTEDRYVSTFLDVRVFGDTRSAASNQCAQLVRGQTNLDWRLTIRISTGCVSLAAAGAGGRTPVFERTDRNSQLSPHLRRVTNDRTGGRERPYG